MQAQEKSDTREIPEGSLYRAKKNTSGVLTPDRTSSYGTGFILALIFLLGNLLVAAIYFHLLNL